MYTMLPLTQVLREGERRDTGEKKGARQGQFCVLIKQVLKTNEVHPNAITLKRNT